MIRMRRTRMNLITIGRRMRMMKMMKMMRPMRIMNMMNGTKLPRTMKTKKMFILRLSFEQWER